MYKMLIVEDEKIEREGLKDLIDWGEMGIEVVNAVESGEEAVDFARNNKVDILLTDIMLTGINGLEVAEMISETNQELKVIISSGYQEFDYAKTAIDLDAYGYLSKPLEVEELEQVFEKVLNTCRKETDEKRERKRLKKIVEESLPLLKHKFFNDLILGNPGRASIMESLKYFNIDFCGGLYTVFVLDLDNYDSIIHKKNREEIHILIFEVLDRINSIRLQNMAEAFHVSNGRFCIIYNSPAGDRKKVYEKLMEYVQSLKEEVNSSCKLDVTIGIGKTVDDIAGLNNSYKKACDAAQFKFFMGNNQIINYMDVHSGDTQHSTVEIEEVQKRIISGIELCDRDTAKKSIDMLFNVLKDNVRSDIYIRNICINILAKVSVLLMDMQESFKNIFGKETLLWEKLIKFDNIFDIRKWFENVLIVIVDYLIKKKEGNNRKIIDRILKIIEENYSKTSIQDIANEVYLSPNYISVIFKKEIGQSFTEYMVNFKMEKAKQMLKETSLKVYQIGTMVGYSNISYFCSAFKNFYGVSPSEYREKV